ncbi:hypothetical protein LJC00_01280 [Dysgonomonas sp. OttesenSCG-928-M03]|nr:hypothetical protein [Dysgonomonas sp. OttesenSCG-928-M03]
MRKNTIHWILILTTISISFITTGCKSKDKVQIELEKVAEKLNKELPIQYDILTRCDSCQALADRTFKYYYTFLFSINDRDTLSFEEKTKPSLLYNIQTSASMEYMRNNHVTFIYSYTDKDGNKWGDIVISPNDYNKPAVKPEQTNFSSFISENNDVDNVLRTTAESVRKQLPIEIKELNMSIVDCIARPNRIFEYTYKLHNERLSEFDSIQYKKETYPAMLETLKNNSSTKALASQEVYLHYIYQDKDGKYLCTVIIPPDEYK